MRCASDRAYTYDFCEVEHCAAVNLLVLAMPRAVSTTRRHTLLGGTARTAPPTEPQTCQPSDT
jgi:hypothetical protein